jgi:hypothetical protein
VLSGYRGVEARPLGRSRYRPIVVVSGWVAASVVAYERVHVMICSRSAADDAAARRRGQNEE